MMKPIDSRVSRLHMHLFFFSYRNTQHTTNRPHEGVKETSRLSACHVFVFTKYSVENRHAGVYVVEVGSEGKKEGIAAGRLGKALLFILRVPLLVLRPINDSITKIAEPEFTVT